MEGKTKICQIVGYQNSGKTTLIQKLLQQGRGLKLHMGTIKHHGHGGAPDTVVSKKDTQKHQEAGAILTAVEGNGDLLLSTGAESWTIEKILALYAHVNLDVILIEGYKNAQFPKLVLIRSREDETLLSALQNIKAVISWYPLPSNGNYPVFLMEEEDKLLKWFFQEMLEDL
jgi:molybdopterin-guanine dinucleotide biosynthesis adapter protein